MQVRTFDNDYRGLNSRMDEFVEEVILGQRILERSKRKSASQPTPRKTKRVLPNAAKRRAAKKSAEAPAKSAKMRKLEQTENRMEEWKNDKNFE